MRVLASILIIGLGATTASAQDWYGEEYQSCEGSTAEMVQCLGELLATWDTRLNVAYREITSNSTAEGSARLQAAQRLWISYRDANCAYYSSGEGTITAIQSAACLYGMTRDRALELELMLQN